MIFQAGDTNLKPQTLKEFLLAVFIRRCSWDSDSEANSCVSVEAKAKKTKLATDVKLSHVRLANSMQISNGFMSCKSPWLLLGMIYWFIEQLYRESRSKQSNSNSKEKK